ncbi:MAG: hypothetical protein IE916_08180 [Epsilonproteobacteria bacterium]|nr:hypothetical protein [Campylobacterota bacterium]
MRYNFRPNTIFVQQKRGFLKSVVQSNGYTLFGVIPFLLHKEHHEDIRGYHITDRKLQRPYLAAVATKEQEGSAHYDAALKLLLFLTSPKAQEIIQKVRIPEHKEHQLFFSVSNFKE